MSRTEHERAIASALGAGDRLQVLFNALGTKEHPTRGVWAAFGMARQTLQGHLGDARLVSRTLSQLRETTQNTVRAQLLAAARVGEKQAAREISIYDDLPRVELPEDDLDLLMDAALAAVGGELEALLAKVRAMALTGVEEAVLLGDDTIAGRVGILRASGIVAAAILWIASTAFGAYSQTIDASIQQSDTRPDEWAKQAIAAIDPRTTQTCLHVHGQVVPLKGKFKLVGTPRYADEMDGPPFHGHCRTATGLVRVRDANDDLTQRMERAGQAELAASAAGDLRAVKFPVDAFGDRSGTEF